MTNILTAAKTYLVLSIAAAHGKKLLAVAVYILCNLTARPSLTAAVVVYTSYENSRHTGRRSVPGILESDGNEMPIGQ